MSNWYPYRWVCQKCEAVHYFSVTYCRRCRGIKIKQEVNNKNAVALALAPEKKKPTPSTKKAPKRKQEASRSPEQEDIDPYEHEFDDLIEEEEE